MLPQNKDSTPAKFGQLFGFQKTSTRLNLQLKPQERKIDDLLRCSRSDSLTEKATAGHKSHTGTWRKSKDMSDSMTEAFNAVQLPWLYRKAVKFLNFLEIEDTKEYFKTNLKAGGIMDVVEQYPWTGDVVRHQRRDKRAGGHSGRVIHSQDGPQLLISWGPPFQGTGTDTFMLSPDGNRLVQVSRMDFADGSQSVTYKTVFHRVSQI